MRLNFSAVTNCLKRHSKNRCEVSPLEKIVIYYDEGGLIDRDKLEKDDAPEEPSFDQEARLSPVNLQGKVDL